MSTETKSSKGQWIAAGVLALGFGIWWAMPDKPPGPADKFACLSQWDGAHPALKRKIQEAARTPSTFEHISTEAAQADEFGLQALRMTYRTENGFGGMVTETVVAQIDGACNIIAVSPA